MHMISTDFRIALSSDFWIAESVSRVLGQSPLRLRFFCTDDLLHPVDHFGHAGESFFAIVYFGVMAGNGCCKLRPFDEAGHSVY